MPVMVKITVWAETSEEASERLRVIADQVETGYTANAEADGDSRYVYEVVEEGS
jgi:hypothetical protein